MKGYASEAALRTALEQRLRDHARRHGVAVVRLRKAVVFERFLARVVTVSAEGWVLKGAYALDVRLGLRARRTVDAGRLRDALDCTFEVRGGSRPKELPEPPASWSVPYRKMAKETGLHEELENGWREVAAMVDFVLSGQVVRRAVQGGSGTVGRRGRGARRRVDLKAAFSLLRLACRSIAYICRHNRVAEGSRPR